MFCLQTFPPKQPFPSGLSPPPAESSRYIQNQPLISYTEPHFADRVQHFANTLTQSDLILPKSNHVPVGGAACSRCETVSAQRTRLLLLLAGKHIQHTLVGTFCLIPAYCMSSHARIMHRFHVDCHYLRLSVVESGVKTLRVQDIELGAMLRRCKTIRQKKHTYTFQALSKC